ncbi:citrate/2-methylcitrate synthase [Kribbella jiaozuonensis]|uniref:citrate synthase (unknown stereospecificity) n=1 Tax=Kribbella jiaozuonensis TaxID=2575441 RepID=A0A4U3LE67_9ACTN|nr:citrate/2-methylcitrate synthase [Kribbella jiaozuonensis]TKK73502.1 helix-turn-helix domain-containing protein [Kribbella jiaozuonensis]
MTAEGDENYLTTAEVARRLQVKPETIYAYVSRGLLTSTRARGRRGSLFSATEVERLASRSVDHSGVVERIESQLTLLQNDELYYRGHPASTLSTTWTAEQVAHLLWTGTAPKPSPTDAAPAASTRGAASPAASPGMAGETSALTSAASAGSPDAFVGTADGVELARAAIAVVPEGARLTDRVRVAVAVLGAADPLRFDLSVPAVTAAAGRLIGILVTALPDLTEQPRDHGDDAAPDATLGARLWPKLSDEPARPEVLDAALILLADHGLAVSTVAARVAASARANLYAVISAGLGALDGQYHGAAPTLAYEFLQRAQQDPLKALSDQLRSGEPIPGFGHRIYQHRDPRAEVLIGLLGDHPIVSTIAAITERAPTFPNSDLAIAAIMHAYNFRPDTGDALFALARMIGWTAHALEEYAAPALRFRAMGIYTGQTT